MNLKQTKKQKQKQREAKQLEAHEKKSIKTFTKPKNKYSKKYHNLTCHI